MKNIYSVTRTKLLVGTVFILASTVAHAQVGGTVYRDFDASSTQTLNSPNEPGVPNVTVNAYLNFSTTPITVTTDAAGAYAFTAAQIPAQAKVRIEFTSLEDGFFFGPAGATGQSNLRFVTAPATGVNCGINYPTEYCQNGETQVIISCFVNGDPLKTTNADGPVDPSNQTAKADVLVSFPIGASGLASATNFPPTHLASASEIGAVWGVAYLRAEKKVLTAANIKRHTGLGTLGTGGIYITDIAAATSSPFFDFQADLNVPTGADPHSGLNPDKSQVSTDPGSMTALGRIGLGGIELSDDSKTLYAVNMFDRKLYGVFIDAPARKPGPGDVKSWTIDGSGCPNGDFRPWAVYSYRKRVYVGGVCSGENQTSRISQYSSSTAALAATLPDTAGLKAIIMRIDPRQGSGATFQTVLSFPLTFPRGAADLTDNCAQFKYWLPWTSEFPLSCNNGGQFVMWPQPMLTDLAFDDNGDMVIGMLDRFGHLAGIQNHNPAGQGSYDGFTSGDLLRASLQNADYSVYKLESNGSVGGRTAGTNVMPGSGVAVSPPYTPTSGTQVIGGVGNNQGPGGGEFYFNDKWYFNAAGRVAHDEVTNGSIMIRPGSDETIVSAFDPITDVYQSGGIKVMSNLNGTGRRDYALYGFNTPGTFGKVSGLGDGKILCDLPGIEIGNRVWYDDNRDGIQDAYEPGIDGVFLALFDMSDGGTGTQVASTTSANSGQYSFNNSNVPTGIKFNRQYQVRMSMAQLTGLTLAASKPSGGARRAASQAFLLSPRASGTAVGSPTRDSDATLIGPDAVISLTTGNFGENNYNYDLSVYSCPLIAPEKESISVCADAAVIPEALFDGSNFSLVDDIRFVYFSSPQSGTAMYTGGTVISTSTPGNPVTSVNSLTLPTSLAANATDAPVNYYVYGIIYPTPADPACRVSGMSKLIVLPKPVVSAVPASVTVTCAQPTAVLAAKTPTPGADYVWFSPPSNTSTASTSITVTTPGVYTLTGSLSGCAGASTTAIVTQGPTNVNVNNFTLTCGTPTGTLTASVSGTATTYPLRWTGPNGFTSTANPVSVTLAGQYTATVTFPNGCTISSATSEGNATQGNTTPPAFEAFGGAKECPTCSVTLVTTATNASLRWTGPNNFTSTLPEPVVQTEGSYTVTVTDLTTGCSATAVALVEGPTPDPCPELSISPGSVTVCTGNTPPAVVVTGTSFAPGQQVRFVRFSSPQSGSAMYAGGTVLATVTPNPSNQATLSPGILAAQLTPGPAQPIYIYAIVSPTPATLIGQPDCRPAVLLTITTSPRECIRIQTTRIR